MKYNWQQKNWPNFQFEIAKIEPLLWSYTEKASRFKGMLDTLNSTESIEAEVELLTREALKSSEIEGEQILRSEVMSSIQRHLGVGGLPHLKPDPRAEGMASLLATLKQDWEKPITENVLTDWHKQLMNGRSHLQLGKWRTDSEPMRIVSGIIGDQTIHFEAPPGPKVLHEMSHFFAWIDSLEITLQQSPVHAAIAHLYFESIHPFEDGNGRIGRALSENILSKGLRGGRVIGLSTTLEAHRSKYYDALKTAQQSIEITDWISWFCGEILEALDRAESVMLFVLGKSKLLGSIKGTGNLRQQKCIERMLKEGPEGFEGGMTAKKYQVITQSSKATATRDLTELVQMGIFKNRGAGRSSRYELNLR